MTNDINTKHKLQTLQIDLESQSYIHNDQAVMYPRSCRRRGDQLAAKPRNDQADRVAKARAELQEKRQRKAMMEKNREVASGGKPKSSIQGGRRQVGWEEEGSLGRVVRTLHDDDSSSESESESEDEAVTAKRPRLSPDAVSELSESKTREYEESLMEKDEEIDALKRENQELKMIHGTAKKMKAIKANPHCMMSEDQVRDIESQVGGLIRMVLLRVFRTVEPEMLIWSDEPDTICGIVMSKLQLSTDRSEATDRALWDMVIAPRFGRKFGLIKNRQVQEMKNVFNGKRVPKQCII